MLTSSLFKTILVVSRVEPMEAQSPSGMKGVNSESPFNSRHQMHRQRELISEAPLGGPSRSGL